MPQVKWWIVKENKKYIETTIQDILLNWSIDESTGKVQEVKIIKVTFGRSNFIEFILYSSENYTRGQNKMYQNMPIIFDMYQLVINKINLKWKEKGVKGAHWEDATTAINLLNNIKYIGKRKPNHRKWVKLDVINEMIIEIDELMENLESYQVMDMLSF